MIIAMASLAMHEGMGVLHDELSACTHLLTAVCEVLQAMHGRNQFQVSRIPQRFKECMSIPGAFQSIVSSATGKPRSAATPLVTLPAPCRAPLTLRPLRDPPLTGLTSFKM